MNAAEARKLSNDSTPKLVETKLQETITYLNERIKIAAQKGEFITGVSISVNEKYMHEVIDRLIQHFSDEGYEVKTVNLVTIKMFYVSWQK